MASIFNFLLKRKHAASALPALDQPKIPRAKGGIAVPGFLTRVKSGDAKDLTQAERRVASTDLLTFRSNATSTKSLVRTFAATLPDMSAAINAYIRLAVTQEYKATARNTDGTINPEATGTLQTLLSRLDRMAGYANGFSGVPSIHSVAESLIKELRIEGACAIELVLDAARLPERLQPVAVSQITFVDNGHDKQPDPVQKVGSDDVSLDYPTFFYESLDQDLLQAYADSPMEPSIQAATQSIEFFNDIRRTIKRVLHPRLQGVVDSEKFMKSLPPEVAMDPEKLQEARNSLLTEIQGTVNGLEPDDALVGFDTIAFSLLHRGNESLSREYDVLQSMTDSKVASGAKVPGAVLGHSPGSQNIASTDAMLFVKYVQGMQLKVNSIFSRALTLGLRLMGYDCYVDFSFGEIDLRPDSELEAFRSMKQSRTLDLLSIGFISDEEAAITLTGKLPPPGAPKLSGTFFRAGVGENPLVANNPYSNTSALNQNLTPGTPQKPKGGAALRAVN